MKTRPIGDDEPVIDGAYIDNDLGIAERSRRTYMALGLLPPPDANLRGKNLWRVSTYRKFKSDLFAGKFAKLRRAPSVRPVIDSNKCRIATGRGDNSEPPPSAGPTCCSTAN
ncbi:MAG: hypothetical protein M3N97_14810 [Pseudomonadota bacterium]|nr:hypothetical protein [Pseudomonadota bacterium]